MNKLSDHIYVWEILYAYINPELSEAYPAFTNIRDIPMGTKYWFEKKPCQDACDKINREKRMEKYLL